MAPVGTSLVEMTAIVRDGSVAARFAAALATSRSQPRYRSHSPAASLLDSSCSSVLIFTLKTTEPPFCASPV
jgi:hypothetical protein